MKHEIEETTTVIQPDTHQVIKTTRVVEPEVTQPHPQKVYEDKKTLFRFNQVIWYILGLVEVLLLFRVVLKALGANPTSGFTNLIYTITQPLVIAFQGILPTTISGNAIMEWSTIIAGFVYICIAAGLVYLLDMLYPLTPEDVEKR